MKYEKYMQCVIGIDDRNKKVTVCMTHFNEGKEYPYKQDNKVISTTNHYDKDLGYGVSHKHCSECVKKYKLDK